MIQTVYSTHFLKVKIKSPISPTKLSANIFIKKIEKNDFFCKITSL